MKTSAFGLALGAVVLTATVYAQTLSTTVVKGPGYTLRARAYREPVRLPRSKKNGLMAFYDLDIKQAPGSPYQWDFVLPDEPNSPYTSLSGPLDSRNQTKTTLRATLRQFDTYEERVTFKDLDLLPTRAPQKGSFALPTGPRFLALSKAQTITTPSGITVTLPVQNGLQSRDLNAVYNGNIQALWVPLKVSPSTRLVRLPNSPLFRKHGRPVSIKIEVTEPNMLVSYAADNTYTGIKVDLLNLQTAKHLNELTLIIQQRVDLQSVPIAIQVPISGPTVPKS